VIRLRDQIARACPSGPRIHLPDPAGRLGHLLPSELALLLRLVDAGDSGIPRVELDAAEPEAIRTLELLCLAFLWWPREHHVEGGVSRASGSGIEAASVHRAAGQGRLFG
jgi:hypothetical protein